ncbi:hypothetical protein [uncultured Gammaproteobacteria bacterium]|nr:hypothetical protein [uncultured Gammaproteobacteria bacterium]
MGVLSVFLWMQDLKWGSFFRILIGIFWVGWFYFWIWVVDFGHKKHFRVYHGKSEFARGNSHINGIESFGVILKQGW